MSAKSIEQFRKIYLAEHGVELSIEEAAELAQRFLNVFRVVMQPMPKGWLPHYRQLLAEQENSI